MILHLDLKPSLNIQFPYTFTTKSLELNKKGP